MTATRRDLSPWRPVPTSLPSEWVSFEKWLKSWGLPWQVVVAGCLLSYENHHIQKHDSNNLFEIQEHKREALNYLRCIEDEDLFTLLHPPYKDLNALLIALAVQAAALDIYAKKTRQGQRYQPEDYIQIENVGQTLLHITKRLGMWYFKRQIEDLIECICNPQQFIKDEQEHRQILAENTRKLDKIEQLLTKFYTETTGDEIYITWIPCGIAGLRPRLQDTYTTATTQKSQLTGTDIVTFDITLPTVKDCYAAFGVLSQLGHIQDRVSDQIAHPKPNGYSHIAFNLILNPQHPLLKELVQIGEKTCICVLQIATSIMQAIMYYGCLYPSCYQIYTQPSSNEQKELTKSEFWQSSEGKIFISMQEGIQYSTYLSSDPSKPIIVYDKNRDFVALPKGATALDFAYEIDIQLGEKAAEAFVNNRKVELKRILDAGDIVEIRTAKETIVQEQWLDEPYAITPKARIHIKKLLERVHLERRGLDLIREALEHQHYVLSSKELDEQIYQLVKEHNLGSRKNYLEQVTEKAEGKYSAEWATRYIIASLNARNTIGISEEPNWIPVQIVKEPIPIVHYVSVQPANLHI